VVAVHVDVDIPLGVLTVVTGVAGSGKSSLIHGSLPRHDGVSVVNQSAIRRSCRSNPATYTGTIVVEPSAEPSGRTVACCRVSSADQRDEVERQAGRVAQEAGKRGITLDATVTEVGSGVTGNRAKLRKILADPR
jgi:ABC-type cobalamin/Fe3+-siderophores transport system ATPase subunit